jgi:hypothetical protein
MTDVNEILNERQNTLVNQVSEVSKSKFFNIRALAYCLGFIEQSVKQLDTSKLEDTYNPNFLNEDLPSEWIAKEGNKLISERFDGFNIIEGFPQTTRLTNYLRSQLFIALMAELENYLVDIIKIILLAYPDKLQSPHFNVAEVLKQDNAADQIQEKVTNKISKKLYASPIEFFNLLLRTLEMETTINQLLLEQNITDKRAKEIRFNEISLKSLFPEYVEMKLRRDLGVHGGWERNEIYTTRITNYGGKVYQGDFLAVDSDYFRRAVDVSIHIVAKCNNFCKLRFSGNT